VVGLLNDPHPRIDFVQLEDWLRDVMGDPELAGEVRKINERDFSDREKTLGIKDLMGGRLSQCKKGGLIVEM